VAAKGTPEQTRKRILIVEDEAIIALDIERRLLRLGFDVVGTADNRDDAVTLFLAHQPHLVLMDIFLRPPVDGIETARTLSSMGDVPVIFLTAYADDETLRRAAQTSPYGYLLKPFDERTLLATLTIGLERHQKDTQLRILQTAVSCSTMGVALTRVSGGPPEIVSCNDAYARLHGATPDALVGCAKFGPPTGVAGDAAWTLSALKSGSEQHCVLHWCDPEGSERWCSVRVSPVRDRAGAVMHAIIFCEDISRERISEINLRIREIEYAELEQLKEECRDRAEQLAISLEKLKSTQDELVRREKLASMGVLVAGVAHEVNTPLGVAVTASSLALEGLRELRQRILSPSGRRSDAISELDRVESAMQMTGANLTRAARLVRHFNSVAMHQSRDEVQAFDLVAHVREVTSSLVPLMRHTNLEVQVTGDASLPVVSLPGSISQVITNFITNAALHAYAPDELGVLTLSMYAEGGEAVLIAEDHGGGMSDAVLRHAFDPFYTTRPGTGGSGLGLFVVYSLVVDGLGGAIAVDSRLGVGTRFEVRFPRTLVRPGPRQGAMDP
jgi:PAS domain S-box-containing protein